MCESGLRHVQPLAQLLHLQPKIGKMKKNFKRFVGGKGKEKLKDPGTNKQGWSEVIKRRSLRLKVGRNRLSSINSQQRRMSRLPSGGLLSIDLTQSNDSWIAI